MNEALSFRSNDAWLRRGKARDTATATGRQARTAEIPQEFTLAQSIARVMLTLALAATFSAAFGFQIYATLR
jgi:hypothetical protein